MGKRYSFHRAFIGSVVAFLLSTNMRATALKTDAWKFTGPDPSGFSKMIDNKLETYWQSPGPQDTGTGFTVDLGRSYYVYRVFLTPGAKDSMYPRSLQISVGDTPEGLKPVKLDLLGSNREKVAGYEKNLIFQPVKGRYVRIAIGPQTCGEPWSVAELEIYGTDKVVAKNKWTAVIVEKDAPTALQLAAEELVYYLTALSNTPAEIIQPDGASKSQGLKIRLVTPAGPPKSLSQPDPMDLEDVCVEKKGNEIVISGNTPRAILYGAYEFLYSQGVRWLYPDAHGDIIPDKGKIDLSVLPIKYRPVFNSRYANFPVKGLPYDSKTPWDSYLFYIRQHFNRSWSGLGELNGTAPRFQDGFGYVHSIGGIFSKKNIEEAGVSMDKLYPGPYRKGAKTPCMSSPEVFDFIVKQIDKKEAAFKSGKIKSLRGYTVHPTDGCAFCECERCLKTFGKPEHVQKELNADMACGFNYADDYFYLINKLAKKAEKDYPARYIKGIAYSNHRMPPKNIKKLPANVLVDYCLHWSLASKASAKKNEEVRKELEEWAKKCSSLGIYDYSLIHSDTTSGRPPGNCRTFVPLVAALSDQFGFYNRIGVKAVGTQMMGNPRNFAADLYAWSRLAWNPKEDSKKIYDDFFAGYYGKAGAEIRKIYQYFEDYIHKNELGQEGWGRQPLTTVFTDQNMSQVKPWTEKAKELSTNDHWYFRQRVDRFLENLKWSHDFAFRKTPRATYPLFQVNHPPKIDGRDDDPAWKSLPTQKGFRILGTRWRYGRPGRFCFTRATDFKMGWDKKYLYLYVYCREPAIKDIEERDKKEKAFYREVVEVFFAPRPPVRYQILFNSAGEIWGPLHMKGSMHSRVERKHPDLVFKTAYLPDGWSVEARIPFEVLEFQPKNNEKIPGNVNRFARFGEGEKFSTWADIDVFNFHAVEQYNWLEFTGKNLTPQQAEKWTRDLNVGFDKARERYHEYQQKLAAFDQKFPETQNLATKEHDFRFSGVQLPASIRSKNQPMTIEMGWKKPVNVTAIKVIWGNRRVFRSWYSLEYWDGNKWQLLQDNADNRNAISLFECAKPVSAGKIRLSVYQDLSGWSGHQDGGCVKKVEIYGKE